MAVFQKIGIPTKLQITRLSLKYFGILSKKRYLTIAMIVIITISKNYLKYESDCTKLELKMCRTADSMKKAFIKAALYNSLWSGSNFLTDYLFEKELTPYGGYIAVKVFKKFLFTDSRIVYDFPGSHLEYYMTEGGKALAKISRFVIFSFLSKLCHFVFDFSYIYKLDNSENKIVTMIFIVFLVMLSMIKLVNIKKVIDFNNLNMDLAYEKEKSITETLDSLAIIKASGTKKHSVARYIRKSYQWESANVSYKFWNLSSEMIYNTLSTAIRPGISILFILWCRPYGKDQSSVENNDVLNYLEKITEMLKTMTGIVTLQTELLQTYDMTESVLEYLKLCNNEIDEKIRLNTFSEEIKVNDLCYNCKDKLIFSDVSFSLKKGQKVVLSGKNGTGKSSIFKLLLGFDEFKGSITFDGVDITKLSMTDYRKLVSYVPQDTKLFDESIYYNLSFGNSKSFKEIIEECKSMGIHDAIMAFPSGYNTNVGEGGKNINGGLKQKLFYTRAFLQDREIYLFDEPTNNLDAQHSRFLLEYMNNPKYEDKTFFVICHDRAIANEFPIKFLFDSGKISVVETL